MSKTRMAGEALSNADRNRGARERIANDPEQMKERLSSVDRDKYDFKGYSDKDIVMAYQGGTFDENDYARLTGKSGGGDDKDKPPTAPPKPPSEDTPPSSPPNLRPKPPIGGPTPPPTLPAPKPPGMFDGGGQQQIVTQDNDINNDINGDNNTVTNNQDNSIRQSMGSSDYATRYANGLKDKYVLNLLGR